MYKYKCLKDTSYAEITDCLNLAFSDYALPIQLTQEQLQTRFTLSGVDKELSYGAFLEDKLIGFIINACCVYNGEKVVFDVGTGIVPEHRGKKVFTKLFSFAEQELLKQGIKKYYLEVLQENDNAIQAYKKQGFVIKRELYVLKSSKTNFNVNESIVKYINLDKFDFTKLDHCVCVKPSFEHSTNILKINIKSYDIAYTCKNQKITAFCIFSKETGHVMQIGYVDICELKVIIQWLMTKFNNIIIKNIDKDYAEVLEMFYSVGAIDIAKQFEMVKDLELVL